MKLINFAKNNRSYNTIRIRYYHDKPVWPENFNKNKIMELSRKEGIVRLYRRDYYTIEELAKMDVNYLILSKNVEYYKKIEYDKKDLGYYPHLRIAKFYKEIEKSNKIKLIKEFYGKGGYTTIYAFNNGLIL